MACPALSPPRRVVRGGDGGVCNVPVVAALEEAGIGGAGDVERHVDDASGDLCSRR